MKYRVKLTGPNKDGKYVVAGYDVVDGVEVLDGFTECDTFAEALAVQTEAEQRFFKPGTKRTIIDTVRDS